MRFPKTAALALLLMLGSPMSVSAAEPPLPDAIAAPGETIVLSVHAEGAQVYECKAGADGKLAWAFREPIATLMADGKTNDDIARLLFVSQGTVKFHVKNILRKMQASNRADASARYLRLTLHDS